jgi:hypothetical protein
MRLGARSEVEGAAQPPKQLAPTNWYDLFWQETAQKPLLKLIVNTLRKPQDGHIVPHITNKCNTFFPNIIYSRYPDSDDA